MRLLLLLVLMNQIVLAEEKTYYPTASYSYFAIGYESITYKEDASIAPIKSEVTVANPALMSGGFTRTTERLAFSIEAISTLYPSKGDEEWNDTIGAFPLAIQNNNFTFSNSSTTVLGHYNLLSNVRLLLGGSYTLSTFKRFNFSTPYPNTVVISEGVVEETFGELIGYTGLAANLKLGDVFINLRALAGLPLTSKIENSNIPDVTFDEGTGFDFEGTLSLNYRVTEEVAVGVIFDAQYHFREKQVISRATTTTELPENQLLTLRSGLFVNWRF